MTENMVDEGEEGTVTLRHRVHRVLYLPLDNRPCNLQTVELLAQMVDYELIVPPVEKLGNFRTPGHPEELADWLLTHAEANLDGLILSMDMLLYGGLWASRTSATRTKLAQQRLQVLKQVRDKCPDATIYAFSTILRLGIIASSDDAAQHLQQLFRYSVLADEELQHEEEQQPDALAGLTNEIPEAVVGEYRAVRRRNHQINQEIASYVADENLDFILYCQDTAAERGLHRKEQVELQAQCRKHGIDDRMAIIMGTDQAGMCLLTRFIHKHMEISPQVRVAVSSETGAENIPEYEDRSVATSLSGHIQLLGLSEIDDDADDQPDIVLAVNVPPSFRRPDLRDADIRTDHRHNMRQFIDDVMEESEGRGLAVCDAAFPNGADDIFVQELVSATANLTQLFAYSGWNAVSNSIGSSLAQSSIRLISLRDKGAFDLARIVGDISPMRYLLLLDSVINTEKAHVRLRLQRLTDDWLYQARVRPRIADHICNGLKNGILDLTGSYQQAEAAVRDELTQEVTNLWIDQFLGKQSVSIGSDVAGDEQTSLILADLQETRFWLPWQRLFEIAMQVEFDVELAAPQEEG